MLWPLLAVCALAGAALPSTQAGDSDLEAAITGSTAYVLGDSQVLGRLAEEKISLSPNGAFVVWTRQSSKGSAAAGRAKRDLVVTNLENEATYELAQSIEENWKAAWGAGRKLWIVLEPVDNPESARTLLTLQVGQPDTLRMARLSPESYGEDLHVFPIPGQGGAVLLGQKITEQSGGALKEEWILSRLDKDAKPLQSASHLRQTTGPKGFFFSPEGKSLVIKADKRGAGAVLAQIGLDDLSLTLIPPGSVQEPAAPPASPTSLVREDGWLWLKGESSSAKVTASQGPAALTSDGSKIIYSAEGHLFAKDVRSITADQLLNERYARAKARAERSARDVGRALRQAWAEGGMSYPPKAEAMKVLGRLVRWDESLDNLVIEFEGGPLPRGVISSQAPYGKITSLFGQATIFLDGTTAWIDGRPR